MLNVKKKPTNSKPLAKPEEAPQEERKENEAPLSIPAVKIELISTPPSTPLIDIGEHSTDEQSVDSVEEATVEEAEKEDTGEDDSSKNEAFDVEVCEEETSKEEDYDLDASDDDGSKDEDFDIEACEVEECDDDLSKDEGPKDKDSKSEESKNEKSKDDISVDEAGPPPAPADDADPSGAPEEDPGEMQQGPNNIIRNNNRNIYKFYLLWLTFWVIALSGGWLSYYFNGHHDLLNARLRGVVTQDENLLLVPRYKWDDSLDLFAKTASYVAQQVVVVQTDTEGCESTTTCIKLLNALKRNEGNLKYNFLLATDGCIYEMLGWQEPSPMYPGTQTMVVAFIGDYETVDPTAMQLNSMQSLLEVSEELKYLNGEFNIIGRKQAGQPNKLFAYMAGFEQWDRMNSDTDEQYIEDDFDEFPDFE